MNKNKFRVVFNRARGLMMVVAENVGSHLSRSNPIVPAKPCPMVLATLRPLIFSMLVMSSLVIMTSPTYADIIADPNAPANQQPIVNETANGLPLVNIQTPSAAGVSRNTYRQFDVKAKGAILNNSNKNTQTQLGGWVQGNPYLAGGTAKVILNEVNSQNPSLLSGYIEVAGSRAQVVIANPAGISCSGCGFINANRATLTTGKPIMNNGNLLGYRVGGGKINFLGNGLDSSQTNFTDVIARAVDVNAGIWANSLNITTGTNQVNVDSNGHQTDVSSIAPNAGTAAPAFAVDVAALGGMYAGKIHMVGTEAGVGVNNASDIGASVGSVSITADGVLQNTGAISAKSNIQLDVAGLESDGSVTADGDISINLASDYIHTSELQAGGNLGLHTSGDITNQSTILASQSLQVSANNIDNTVNGEIAGLDTNITAADTITNHGLIDGVNTLINADNLFNSQTGSIFGDQIGIQVAQLGNDAGAVLAARDQLDIGAVSIENRNDSLIFSAGDLAIAGSLDGANQAIGAADSLINDGATIEALGNTALTIADLQNLNAELITEVVQTGSGSFDRFTPRGASVIYETSDYPGAHIGNVHVEWRSAGSYTFREYTRYLGTKRFYETQIVSSAPGQIFSGGDMLISGSVLNSDSQIIAGGNLDVTGASVQNLNSEGRTTTSYSGTAYYYDWDGNDNDYDVDVIGPYNPANQVVTYNLATTQFDGNTVPVGSGTTVNSAALPIVTSNLFQPIPDVAADYLIETNPRFANYRSWLSSDYMLQQLTFDPATTQKRLGDGFYEQRLVREQIAQLTGRRFLDGHANDEAQYQALMTSALTQVSDLQLIPGVALSAEQMAQLTSDIVWLVEQTVTLPDGTVTQALVPQVYIRPQTEDMQPTTGLMAGNTVIMNLTAGVTNEGTIAGRDILELNADNINNLGGQIVADSTLLTANNDINNIGGQVIAKDAMLLEAGNDIHLQSTTQSSKQREGASSFSRTNIDRVAGLYLSNPDAILVASAGNDVNLMAASIVNQGEGGITQINAEENINLGTVQIAEQNSSIRNAKNYVKHGGTQEIGSDIQTTGGISFNSGNDVNATATSITSETGAINVTAMQDINIIEGRETSNFDTARKVKRSSTFSSKTKIQRDVFKADNSIGSTISGDTLMLEAGNDLNIRGSNVISDNGTVLTAGDNVNVTSSSNTAYEFHERKTKKSGFNSSDGSITIGSSQLNTKQTTNRTSQTGSTVGSLEGNVTINSGKTYTQKASDVLTPQGNIDITAQHVNIVAGENFLDTTHETKFKQSGLTFAIQSSALNLAQNVFNTAQSTLKSERSRNKALNALQTYGNSATLMEQGSAAIDAINAGEIQDAASSAGIKLSISVGSSKSESFSSSSLTNNQGSLVKAGGDVSIKATQDDLTVAGSHIAADKNVTLDASRNINLIASADKETNQSKNKSSSASIGISIGVGGEGTGLSLDLAASRGKGKANSDSMTYNNTQVSAGETLALNSGNDTNLIGANASGKQVIADVAGDLNIESVQDKATSKAKQNNTGISISIPIGAGIAGGSISNSKQKSNSNYASVYEQSGIKAGGEGFDITVAGNTDLKGAVIESAASSDKNELTTSTLTVNDIQNHMDADASSQGIILSKDMLSSKYAAAKGLASNLQNHGEADIKDGSTTLSAISPASITITDETAQIALTDKNAEETLASLNRDTSDTNRVLERPDMEALQEKAQQEQADKLLLSATISTFTDEAFKKMFLAKAKIFEVARDDEGKVVRDGQGKPIMHEIDETEKIKLKANGENKKLNVFTNGLFNDESAAGAYSIQMAEAPVGEKVYLVHFPDANNFLAELLVAGYQKGLESAVLGNTNATQEIINLSQIYGQEGLNLIGHSRGAMTIGNAMETLQTMGLIDPLSNTNIKFVGPAYSAQEAANSLDTLSGGNHTSVELQNHTADFVGRLIGGNPSTYGQVSEGSSLIKEWINIFGEATSAHSCYGGSSDVCRDTYGKAISINIPAQLGVNN
ncbi:MAG: hemagglutinin repeat-containing protein [Methylophaga sp.]|uniref:hemagglutinin repeat-containing protein n=1 Tax=Methylophaga sp. TaxID=2024840 RepID=UPI00299F3BE5|nr:hemagglutinin repeat-containing protein [Methylophaga sp.]MDX1750019.1 hemagglutinin repeat-containing protein [Methylophaga sp.]